ncbi:hypothetical protein [Streptomyces sp. NPDC012508]|uniref:hypothetical protein n=1 Tax=Streptomyces sp. NPDC012508 TaxID=3364837 RepID=UPI0036C9CDCC
MPCSALPSGEPGDGVAQQGGRGGQRAGVAVQGVEGEDSGARLVGVAGVGVGSGGLAREERQHRAEDGRYMSG